MNKSEFLSHLIFDETATESEASFYLDTKGVSIHLRIVEHLGFNLSNQKLEWTRISALLRYDKKLRDKIYVYLATLEEYIRAYISNNYEDNPIQNFWISAQVRKVKISDRISAGEKVSAVLESTDFNVLIQQVNKLPPNDKIALFGALPEITKNLEAVRELRNAVSHHTFLRGYKFLECLVDGVTDSSLEHNIKNLRQLLPEPYRYGKNGKGGISADIEKCRFEYVEQNGKEVKREMLLDSCDIVKLD